MSKDHEIIARQIFFVGENISRYLFAKYIEEGLITPLQHTNLSGEDARQVAGCAIKKGLDPAVEKHLIQRHALRIASRIFRAPGIGLTGASAINDTLTGDVLHLVNISGVRRQSRLVGDAFAIAINNNFLTSAAFSLQKRTMSDGVGDFDWYSMPYEGVFLTSFSYDNRKRERIIHRPIISTEDRIQMLRRLVTKHDGNIKSAWRNIWQVAKALNISDFDVSQAKAFIVQQSRGYKTNFPKIRLDVFLNTEGRIGQITSVKQRLDSEAAWAQEAATSINSLNATATYRFPVFLETLLPERFGVVDDSDRSRIYPLFARYRRYLNNISIGGGGRYEPEVFDRHASLIEWHSTPDGVFIGNHNITSEAGKSVLTGLAEQSEQPDQPAIPGMQDKIALSMSPAGCLSTVGGPQDRFTHILKFGRSAQMEPIPAGEWFCAQLMRAAGITTASSALIELDADTPLCFVSERFDIPSPDISGSQIVFEDGCAITGTPIHRKYAVPMENLASRVFALCGRDEDGEQMLRQVIASFLVGNTDAHARNFGVVTTLDKSGVASTRLAPAFDVVCTIGLPWISSSPALAINKSRAYNMATFEYLGNALGLPSSKTRAIVIDVAHRMKLRSEALLANLPEMVLRRDKVVAHLQYIDRLIEMASDYLSIPPPGQAQELKIESRPSMRPR